MHQQHGFISLGTLLVIVGIAVLAWAPWLTVPKAEERATKWFDGQWEGAADGCGFDCPDCGPQKTTKLPFGAIVDLRFACGLMPGKISADQASRVFVSAFMTVHQLSRSTYTGSSTPNTESFTEYRNAEAGISLRYPKSATAHLGGSDQLMPWPPLVTEENPPLVQIEIPTTIAPATNFQGAWLTLALLHTPACVPTAEGREHATTTETIGRYTYTHLSTGDAGAGNFYDIDRYATEAGERCMLIETVIHSTNIANYPEESGVSEFDESSIRSLLRSIIATVEVTE